MTPLHDIIGAPATACAGIDIVDIGANRLTPKPPPYQYLLDGNLGTLIGFEPDGEAFTELERTKGSRERYLPVAVGDGRIHRLNICFMSGMNSLLTPNFPLLGLTHMQAGWARIERTVDMPTVRLDDCAEIERIDYLKIDIQGGELMVFENAVEKLKDCLVVHTEAMFVPMYEGQPLFSDQEIFLRRFGLMVHKFDELVGYALKPFAQVRSADAPLSQIFWADVVFIRNLTALDRLTPHQLLKTAAILHHAYGSIDVVNLCLQTHDSLTGSAYAAPYVKHVLERGPRA